MILWLFLLIYTALLGAITVLGYFLQRRKEANYTTQNGEEETVSSNDLVVIIPFRNEEKRIDRLLQSIRSANKHPKEYIFIDDHSDDNTVEFIINELQGIPFRILHSPEDQHGKKNAIRLGIDRSDSEFILSMDADLDFSPDYFSDLEHLKKADMYVLPAIMKPQRGYEHLFEVDLVLVNAANAGLAGLKRPIMASGANLLYRRSAFVRLDNFKRHQHMPSGDDIYLLRDFREGGADIRLFTHPNLAIYTETPQSLREFIHQRLRWIAKTGDVKDHLSTSLAIIQAILTLCFFGILVYLGISAEWKMFAVFFAQKAAVDMILFLPYFNRIRRTSSWLFIPIYEVIFPFYTLFILVMMYFFKPEWKGRKLTVNY